ncbi:MarR family winged helix-turn-helix transcriptional regulator [Plantactinospora sp. KLBMP9567]|uniref:MarR family winged helix-turn-helix transcriptional regulator n=1 Tax=Plantactinospora sp. KLBMP9567 TaxID=3085900 RepID=UPI0029815F03|nr:MarR family transcriptional regulator [Plantactinospora sp. KLBMP9567]MDW5323636.1 MarR family transcriptional regulator [Plantactinospora sp. KLBMP9567]
MSSDEARAMRDAVSHFVRMFGLHRPEQTPCGQAMSVSEAHALAEIHREGGLRQVELARRLRLEKSTVSRLVGQLVGRGWLERTGAAGDGRGVWLTLTAQGCRAADRLAAAREARFAALLDRIPPDERPAILAAVRRLAEAADDQ